MKLFLSKIVVFIVLSYALASLGDYAITTLLKKSRQDDYGVWNDLFGGNVNADIVIHGSSRAWVQFNPQIIEQRLKKETYNLGVDGYGFHMQYCRHLLLLKHNRRPSIIVHVLDYGTLDKGEFLYNLDQFLPYLKDSLIDTFTSSYIGFDHFDRALPYLRYVGRGRAIQHAAKILLKQHLNTPNRYKGFQGQEQVWSKDLEYARAAFPNQLQENVNSTIVRQFIQYIKDCQRQHIQLIFVYPPEYVEGHDSVKNRDEILSMYRSLANQYHIPFLDYSNHSISSEKRYFYNTQHLNLVGANFFTDIFCTDVQSVIGQ